MNRDTRGANNTAFDTITAAAIVMASTDNRVSQDSPQKRKWSSWLKIYWCFGSYTQTKRIGPSVNVHETSTQSELPLVASLVPQFAAPPSSPVSFLQSGPPSSIQSPATSLSLTYISANIHSPGPSNIFAIGPYANDTQLVSPPVFSTEPSTAPFTPTTPSSPEVPFARVLDANNVNASSRYSLMSSYEFQPGSPISHLISPRSAISISGSGTSSPFPDHDFGSSNFLHFKIGEPPKFLNSTHDWGSRQESGSLTPKYRDESLVVTREESAEDAMRRLAKKLLAEAVNSSLRRDTIVNVNNKINVGKSEGCADWSGNLGHSREFNFENVGGNSVGTEEWWAKEKKREEEDANDWSFFPPTK